MNRLKIAIVRRLERIRPLKLHVDAGLRDEHRSRSHTSNRHRVNPVILGVDLPRVRPLVRIRVHNIPLMGEHIISSLNRRSRDFLILIRLSRHRKLFLDLSLIMCAIDQVETATDETRDDKPHDRCQSSAPFAPLVLRVLRALLTVGNPSIMQHLIETRRNDQRPGLRLSLVRASPIAIHNVIETRQSSAGGGSCHISCRHTRLSHDVIMRVLARAVTAQSIIPWTRRRRHPVTLRSSCCSWRHA